VKLNKLFQVTLLFISFLVAPPLYAVCIIVSVSNGSFGTVTTQNNVTNYHLADVTVSCDSFYLLGLDTGSHPTSSRQLAHTGGATIPYSLFQGATASEWGSQNITAANTYPLPALAGNSGTNIVHSIYATALTKDKVPQGSYNDTVTVILADSAGTLLDSTTINFNLNLVAFCTLNTQGFGSFGSYPVGSARVINAALGSIVVTCPETINYKIGIDKGLHLANSMRRMGLNDSVFIPYILRYNSVELGDSGLTAIDSSYNETFSTASAVSNTGTGIPQNFMIYGDAWVDTATSVGTYTDTLIVTLVW
jgi:spore coat protein U-like protein